MAPYETASESDWEDDDSALSLDDAASFVGSSASSHNCDATSLDSYATLLSSDGGREGDCASIDHGALTIGTLRTPDSTSPTPTSIKAGRTEDKANTPKMADAASVPAD